MSTPQYVSPVPAGAAFLRIDQGVDWDSPSAVVAVGAGVIAHIGGPGSFAGGTGQVVYETLAHPVVWKGITYPQIYYAERAPLVALHQPVRVGQPVMGAGTNEIGFARNNVPAAPLIGGLGAGTQKTIDGQNFYDFVQSLSHAPVTGLPPGPGGLPPGAPPSTTTRAYPTHAHKAFHDLQAEIVVGLPKALRQTRRIRAAMVRRAR